MNTLAPTSRSGKPLLIRALVDTPRVPQLLYVMGYGHSGSTVLNIVLGQHPDMHGAGELCLLSRAWLNGEYCSCGQTIATCEVWAAVVSLWRERMSVDPVRLQTRLQRAWERVAVTPAFRSGAERGVFDDYAALSLHLLAAVAEVTGKRWVIDSSKRASRALALNQIGGIDLRAVHLIRDSRGVAWSMRRALAKNTAGGVQRAKRPQPTGRTCLSWTSANLTAEWFRRKVGPDRSVRLRYEDFVLDPKGALADIGAMTGLDFEAVVTSLLEGQSLDPGHVVAGNRMRMAGAVKLRLDQEWQSMLPPVQRRIANLVSAPLLHRYGYR